MLNVYETNIYSINLNILLLQNTYFKRKTLFLKFLFHESPCNIYIQFFLNKEDDFIRLDFYMHM